MVKSLFVMQETQVQSLCGEDLLGKGMAIHSSVLAWRILWTEEPGSLQPMGLQRAGHDGGLTLSLLLSNQKKENKSEKGEKEKIKEK